LFKGIVMTIKYADRRSIEAVLLFQTNHTMRVVLKGSDDATYLTEVNGTWFSEDWESVYVEGAGQSRYSTVAPSVSDCVCSKELASMLVDLVTARSRASHSKAQAKHFTAGSPAL
jgi:hypothetical protein